MHIKICVYFYICIYNIHIYLTLCISLYNTLYLVYISLSYDLFSTSEVYSAVLCGCGCV